MDTGTIPAKPARQRHDVKELPNWAEFVFRLKRMSEDKKWTEAFKAGLVRVFGSNVDYMDGDTLVGTYSSVDRFKAGQLKKDAPELYEQYVTYKYTPEFDEERFKAENPGIYDTYLTASFNLK